MTELYSLQGAERISAYHRISRARKQITSVGNSAVHWITVRATQFSTQVISIGSSNSTSQHSRLHTDTGTITYTQPTYYTIHSTTRAVKLLQLT